MTVLSRRGRTRRPLAVPALAGLGVLALSVIITPLFNAAQGSILMAALFHFQVNGPAWPDAQPWENYLFAVVDKLKAEGIRAQVDISSDRFPKKIRTASKQKVPYVLIAGGEDRDAGAASFR